ncbi:MAG: pilus assembly FimT family protein [Planctomycetota bacterium]|jgi:prepilin-type N-terminal cleavage/methylation domain-containing protein
MIADRRSTRGDRSKKRNGGFTLVEIMVVIAIIALAGQIVVLNLGALVPSTLLDSTSREIIGQIEFLRSEAQLQGKVYELEADLDQNRWRIILPQEERLTSDQTIEEELTLNWQDMDDRICFDSLQLLGGHIQRSGRARITMDENGFTADMVIAIRMNNEAEKDLVWSIRLRGLDRKSELSTSQEGEIPRLEVVEEGHF